MEKKVEILELPAGAVIARELRHVERQTPGCARVPHQQLFERDGNYFKLCGGCKQYFPANKNYFGPDKSSRTGLNGRCKSCAYEYAKAQKEKAKLKLENRERQLQFNAEQI